MEEFPDTLTKAINTLSTHNVQPKSEIYKSNQNNNYGNKKQEKKSRQRNQNPSICIYDHGGKMLLLWKKGA